MDDKRRYGRSDLIEAYLGVHDHRHDNSGRELLDGLERLFGVRLAGDGEHAALFPLFESTVRSLLALDTPWNGYAEAGLLHRELEATPVHARVMAASDRIWEHTTESARDHRDILDALVTVFLGDRADDTFSAEDLRAVGATPPEATGRAVGHRPSAT